METIYSPDIFGSGIKAFFTGKGLGVDIGRISELLSIPRQRIYMPLQRHTDKIHVLVESDREPRIADAVLSGQRNVLLGVQGADCVPILLCDKAKHVVGAVHAGWRGTAAGIVKQTIETMSARFCSSPSDIAVALGPSIRWCCYGVGYEVIEGVRRSTGKGDYVLNKGERYCLDLVSANRYQALSMGVLPENIWTSDDCTFCSPERFYSYRFARGPTGRQGGFIGIF